MHTATHASWLATAAAISLMATAALAGDAVKLTVEVPSESRVLVPGERVAVQVVGVDAAGARVGFGGRDAVLAADHGRTEVVTRPYQFAFVAPDRVTGSLEVTLSAHLDGAAAVKGATTVRVVPRGRFVQLVLSPEATTATLGSTTTIRVRGELRDGSLASLGDKIVDFEVRGPRAGAPAGAVRTRGDGLHEYVAPPVERKRAVGGNVRLIASLRGHDGVVGELTLRLLTGDDEPPPAPDTPPVTEDPPPADDPDGERGGSGRLDSAGGPAGDEGEDDDGPGVLWPGGHLRLLAWRVRPEAGADWSRKIKRVPEPGGEFVAPGVQQGMRFRIEERGVVGVTLHWWRGKRTRGNVRRETGAQDGEVLSVRQVGKQRHVLLSPTLTNKARVTMRITLRRRRGGPVHVDVVARRGRPGQAHDPADDGGEEEALPEPVKWPRNEWDEVLTRAKRRGGHALIGFTERGNEKAAALDAAITGDLSIQEELGRFQRTLVVVGDEGDVAGARLRLARMRREYGTTDVPLHVIVDAQGKELARFTWKDEETADSDYLAFLRSVK